MPTRGGRQIWHNRAAIGIMGSSVLNVCLAYIFVLVELALVLALVLDRIKTVAFTAAALIFAFLIAFSVLSDRISEITVGKIGSIKTAEATATQSVERIKKLEENAEALQKEIAEKTKALGEQIEVAHREGKQNAERQVQTDKELEKIKLALIQRGTNATLIARIEEENGLSEKYPLGFMIIYSDSHEIIHSNPQAGKITFDMSDVKVSRSGGEYCMNRIPLKIEGRPIEAIQGVCFGGRAGVIHAALIDYVQIDIEPLALASDRSAWVIGARNTTH
jgi:hypothetical protein